MSDTWLEAVSQRIGDVYQAGDRNRLLIGALLSRLEKRYGAGTVTSVATNTGIRRATLYEYGKIWTFYRGHQMSAARILRTMPNLLYSHLRAAMRLGDWEAAFDLLVQASDEGWTADRMAVEVDKLNGKSVPPAPLFDVEGHSLEVMNMFLKWRKEHAVNRRLRVTVRAA